MNKLELAKFVELAIRINPNGSYVFAVCTTNCRER